MDALNERERALLVREALADEVARKGSELARGPDKVATEPKMVRCLMSILFLVCVSIMFLLGKLNVFIVLNVDVHSMKVAEKTEEEASREAELMQEVERLKASLFEERQQREALASDASRGWAEGKASRDSPAPLLTTAEAKGDAKGDEDTITVNRKDYEALISEVQNRGGNCSCLLFPVIGNLLSNDVVATLSPCLLVSLFCVRQKCERI